MLFYQWYGKNVDESIPEFNQSFKFIKTIGVSLFREKTSTSRHFGPMRLLIEYYIILIRSKSWFLHRS